MPHTYKVVRIVGSSPDGIQAAIDTGLSRAARTLRNLDWFEVKEIRGAFKDNVPGWYQVGIDVGFRIEDDSDLRLGD